MNMIPRPFLAASSVVVITAGIAPVIQAANWLTTGTTDWNTPANWSTNRVPIKTGSNDQAVINTNTGSIATISANISATPTDILVGSGASTNGRLDHTAGTAQSGNGNWVKVGNSGGTGVYNLANTATTNAGISGFAQGTGSLASGGHLRVGAGDNGSGSTGTLNINTTGTVTATQIHVGATANSNGRLNLQSGSITSGDFYVGNGNAGGSGRVDIAGGSVTVNAWAKIGHEGGTGTINLANTASTDTNLTGFAQGSGNLTITGNFRVGGGDAGTNGTGNFNMNTTGTLSVNEAFHVGTQSSKGVMKMDGGTITANNVFYIGNGANANGEVSIGGGNLNKLNGNAFSVGNGGLGALTQTGGAIVSNGEFWVGSTSNGVYTMSGGSLTTNNWFVVGRNGNGVGTLNMSGGTITKEGSNNVVIGADSGSANGTITMTGGLFNVTGGTTTVGHNAGTGVLTLSETAEYRTTLMTVGNGSGIGTVNLNGGILELGSMVRGGGTANANFNGTQIVAKSDSPTFINGLTTAVIQAGGLKIDSHGKNLVTAQAFTGSGDIIKSGAGSLTFTASSPLHTGDVYVNAGTLAIDAVRLGGVDFTVADEAVLKVISGGNYDTRQITTLTLGSSGASKLSFDLGNVQDNPVYAPVKVDSLVMNGPVTVDISDQNIALGSIPLVEYTSKSGAGGVVVIPGSLPNGVGATVVDNGSGLISLEVATLAQPRWDATESDLWDLSTQNWFNAGERTFYENGRVTQFDDTVTGATGGAVVINMSVTPGALIFDNSSIPYTIGGTGSIDGTTGIVKRGLESLALNTANGYTGVTELKGGTTSIKTLANATVPSSIGAASASPANLVLNGGHLAYTGLADATTDRGFTIAAEDSVISTTANIRFDGEVVSTPISKLIKNGTGKLGFGGTAPKTIGTANKGLRILGGTVSFTGTGANSVASELWVGDRTATGNTALEVVNSNLNTGFWIAGGVGNGTTGLHADVIFTNSTITTNAGGISLGYADGVVGYSAVSSLTMTNSTFTGATGNFGESSGATVNITLNGTSALNLGQVNLAINGGTSATMLMKDSSTCTATGQLYIAGANGSVGSLTVQDSASLTLPGDQEFRVGNGGQGTLTQTGGSISGSGWMSIGRVAGGTGFLNISGGTFTQAAPGRFMHVGELGTGTLTVSNTGSLVALSTTGLLIADTADSSGTVNLNGGTITANAVLDNASGTSVFNFNGGRLKAGSAANTVFMSGIDTVTVQSGGALIDSNGHDIIVNSALLNGGTGGGLTKEGAGRLTLAGANTYAGNTTVSAGALTLGTAGQLRFFIGANGVNNKVTGTGSVQLDGTFNIDTSAANTTAGNTWTLVDVGSLTEQYGGSFNLAGFSNNAGTWTKNEGGNLWTFTQIDGLLTVQAAGNGYSSWASANAGNQGADLDYDGDGVKNGVEYFMGQTGSGFTANPSLVGSQITWPKSASYSGTYRVEISTDLVSWTDVTNDAVDNGSSVSYTLPNGGSKRFVHLVVIPN